jgi:flagellar assembly protein FliH
MFANFDRSLPLVAEPDGKQDDALAVAPTSIEEVEGFSMRAGVIEEEVSLEISESKESEEAASQTIATTQMLDTDQMSEVEMPVDDSRESGESSEVVSVVNARGEASTPPEAPAELEPRIEREVQKRLAAAQEEREQMLAQVQQSAYAKALEDAKQEYSSRFETLVEDTRSQIAETIRDNEQQAVELAFQIARKLIGTVVTDHREYIQDVISEALKAAGNAEIHSVRVSPQDFEFLSASQMAERAWKLERDDSIGAGCIVVTSSGEVDFDLEKSWTRMREKVTRGPKS